MDFEYDSIKNMDQHVIDFITMIQNKEKQIIPEPSEFVISTQSAMCNFHNVNNINLSKIVVEIGSAIVKNLIIDNNQDYLIKGMVVDNLLLRFDDSYLKKYKYPLVSYGNKIIENYDTEEEQNKLLEYIKSLESNSLKKHGRQKEKKDNENFYNSCSIIAKGNNDLKSVNIKLFNNGKITLTGSKEEFDGLYASKIVLRELIKYPEIFEDNEEKNVETFDVVNFKTTMINSDFSTFFKIDLLKLLMILNSETLQLFTKFNPEKYRGLIIGFYWNTDKPIQNGLCKCTVKCNGKGCGTGNGKCKKVTISIFKSGRIIITGAQKTKQIEDAYSLINQILKDNYTEVVKLSILDFID
jgi:TATA-box binding protein (TBP) (component of TFIID and TFIIIB)